ncbi:unknown [Clostridium sp. CAG:492]|nr:unknown [Clostridium sp. CAG:492]
MKENSIEEDIECRQDFLEFDLDGDWAELKKILNKSRKTNEYIMYKGEKWIKEKYCIPIQKLKDIIKKLNIDIERNKRRKIQHNEDGSLQMEMIAYDPAIIKMRLLKLLESEE